MLTDGGFNAVLEDMMNRRKRGRFIKLGQPRIALNIQRNNGHKPAFNLGHDCVMIRSSIFAG